MMKNLNVWWCTPKSGGYSPDFGVHHQFFISLKLVCLNLGRWEFAQFPSLGAKSSELTDGDLVLYIYVKHLMKLHDDIYKVASLTSK